MKKCLIFSLIVMGVLATDLTGCRSNVSMVTEESSTMETTLAPECVNREEKDKTEESGIAAKKETVVSEKTIDRLENIEKIIDEHFIFETDEQTMQEGIIRGYIEGLDDPYSVYLTAEEYAEYKKALEGEMEGVGVPIVLTSDADTDRVIIWKVYGLAKEAGIKEQDILVKIDGEDIASMNTLDIRKKFRGEEGSEAVFTIYRPLDEKEYDFTIHRERMELPTIEYRMLENQIGYVQVLSFGEATGWQYIRAIQELNSQGMEGLIVDLRYNGGGSVKIAAMMLDYMLPAGRIAYTEDKDGNVINTYNSTDADQFNKPLAVLVDGNSASASEIYAGAIKDYGIGTIIGETTYGKGITQRNFLFSDGSAMKLTTAKWFTPKGNNIHMKGIEPDLEVKLDEDAYIRSEGEEDNQLQAAITNIMGKMEK